MAKEKQGFKLSPAFGCFCMSGFALFGSVISIIFLTVFGFHDVFGFAPFIGPLIFGIIAVVMFVVGVGFHIRFKNHQMELPTIQPYTPTYQSYSSAYNTTSLSFKQKGQEIVHKTQESLGYQIDWRKIAPLIYKGELLNEKCPICKLLLQETDIILQCSNCTSLFHDQHFISWIINNHKCPVCFVTITIR